MNSRENSNLKFRPTANGDNSGGSADHLTRNVAREERSPSDRVADARDDPGRFRRYPRKRKRCTIRKVSAVVAAIAADRAIGSVLLPDCENHLNNAKVKGFV